MLFFWPAVQPLLRLSSHLLSLHALAAPSAGERELPGNLLVREHVIQVPVCHEAGPAGPLGAIDLFVRELVPADKPSDTTLPCLLYLQGGPGFPSRRPTAPPSGWVKAALEQRYRVFLLDQRGTGRSSPVTAQSLASLASPSLQAEYLSHFRADSIVRDCELVRRQVCKVPKLTLLGQSFGGFCILTYLSLFPKSIERAIFTFGLAPVGRSAEEVYRATFTRMEERNRRFYERYPEDVEVVRAIVASLEKEPPALPRGGTLTPRRFLQLGLLLGSASGFEDLHDLLELSKCPPPTATGESSTLLPDHFLLAVEEAQQQFETNPIYWLLHEAIYCDGAAEGAARGPSDWAAERVQASLGERWDYTRRLEEGAPPVLFSGEMHYSWMGDDYAWLRPLKPAAQLLAGKQDWGPLYDQQVLSSADCPPVACLVSYEDIYVERKFAEETATMLGGKAKLWITNEFQHSGLRDDPAVFEKLLKMAKGVIAIPS